MVISSEEVASVLTQAVAALVEENGGLVVGDDVVVPDFDVSTRSFAEAMVLTENDGFVLRLGDSVFQVSVVRVST